VVGVTKDGISGLAHSTHAGVVGVGAIKVLFFVWSDVRRLWTTKIRRPGEVLIHQIKLLLGVVPGAR